MIYSEDMPEDVEELVDPKEYDGVAISRIFTTPPSP